MAETIGDKVEVTKKESIARVELFTDATKAMDDWKLVIHFEEGLYDGQGTLLAPTRFGSRSVERRFGDIKGDKVVATLVAAIREKAYEYRAADIERDAREKAEAEAREAARIAEMEKAAQEQAAAEA